MIGVGGCVASQEGAAINKRAPYVDLVFGPQTLHRLPAMVAQARKMAAPVVDLSFPEIAGKPCSRPNPGAFRYPANNQLSDEAVALQLKEAGVLYAPDYVINAGGVISAAHEFLGLRDESWVNQRIDAIGSRLRDIFARADAQSKSPDQIAEIMALEILAKLPQPMVVNK